MEEKTLLKISLAVSLLGIILLYFISLSLEPPALSGTSGLPAEEKVRIKGILGKITEKDKVAFLEILNQKIEKTEVVLFGAEPLSLKEGDYVEVSGTVEEYEGKKEVIATKIVKK